MFWASSFNQESSGSQLHCLRTQTHELGCWKGQCFAAHGQWNEWYFQNEAM